MSSSYKPSNFSVGNTYNDRTLHFVGVDLTSPQMDVDHKRGVYSRNYLHKPNGKVETRFGYQRLYMAKRGDKVIGLWQFTDPDGDVRGVAVVLHTTGGIPSPQPRRTYTELHEFTTDEDGIYIDSDEFYSHVGAAKAVWATESNNKLWLLTGYEYIVVSMDGAGDLQAEKVSESEETHIPTVTYMGIASNAETVPSNTFLTLEYPNALSKYRKDMFLTGLGPSSKPTFQIQMKKSGSALEEGSMIYPALSTEITVEYTDSVDGNLTDELRVIAVKETLSGSSGGNDLSGITYQRMADDTYSSDYSFWIVFAEDKETHAVGSQLDESIRLGFLYFGEDKTFIELNSDYQPLHNGKPNMTVKYQYISDNDFANQIAFIDGCTFGKLFGANNSLNRLWLSGNESKPNYVIHSQEPYTANQDAPRKAVGDFSYIPDEGLIKFGEPSNAVIGMEVLTSDSMMVVKNKAGGARTMYFVKPVLMTEQSTGIIREEYSTSMSNTMTAGLTKYGFCTFNGDALFLSSERQLVGMDIEGITGDSRRVANTRSKYIDKELSRLDLSGVKVFASANYVFVIAKETMFLSHYGQQADGQYEWWPCDPFPGDEFYFITELFDGRVIACTSSGVFTLRDVENGEAVDSLRYFFGYDNLELGVYDGHITVSSTVSNELPVFSNNVDEESLCTIHYDYGEDESNAIFYKVCSNITNVSGALYFASFDNEPFAHDLLAEGEIIYETAGGTVATSTATIVPYEDVADEYIEEYGYNGVYFQIADVSNTEIEYVGIAVKGEEWYAFIEYKPRPAPTRAPYVYLYRRRNGIWQMAELVHTQEYSVVLKGYFENRRKITPVFLTMRLNQDHVGYDKTIRNMTVWNDSSNPSELYVGIITNKNASIYEQNAFVSPGVSFDLSNLNLENLDFDKALVPTYRNLKRFPRLQQSFTVCFTAKSKRNSVLGGIDILYSVKKAHNKR